MLFATPGTQRAWRSRTRLVMGFLAVWVPVTALVVVPLMRVGVQGRRLTAAGAAATGVLVLAGAAVLLPRREARHLGVLLDDSSAASAGVQTALERAAAKVGEAASALALLEELADQISLLAVNASIEAARAGDSGPGFAVVADEVRHVAERSKVAGAEIGGLLEATRGEVSGAPAALEQGAEHLHTGLGRRARR